jgi:hypothetical protein
MMNANWMVTLAIAQRKALRDLGYTSQQVNAMSLADTTQELKTLGYNFKANSPFKNKAPYNAEFLGAQPARAGEDY